MGMDNTLYHHRVTAAMPQRDVGGVADSELRVYGVARLD
jgi:hypothetical protein